MRNEWVNSVDRDKIVKLARSYEGTKYVHMGRSIAGLDCIGLVIKVGEDLGYTINHRDYPYEQVPDPSTLWAGMNDNFIKKLRTDYLPGDILVFRVRHEPQHMAIYLGDNRIIHSFENAGYTVEVPFCNRWKKRLLAVYSYE